MGRPADVYNAFRRRVYPTFHAALDVLIGGYALSDTPPEEYVGTLHCSEPEAEELLSSLGFSRNLIASLKVRADGNVSDGSWVHRDSLFGDHQLHVILHETDAGVETYAHREYSSIRHPYQHYLARDYSAEKGVEMMQSILEETTDGYGVSWTIEPAYQRHTWYVSLLRTVSVDLARKVVGVREQFTGGLTEETPGVVQQVRTLLR